MTGSRALPAWRAYLDLLTVWGFAVAQPIYDLLAREPAFLVAHRATPRTIVGMVVLLSVVLPLLLVAVEALIRTVSSRAEAVVHLILMASAMTLVALAPLSRSGSAMSGMPQAVALAAGAGVAFAALYALWRPVRLFLALLSPSVVVFPLLFLLFSPARHLAFPRLEIATPVAPISATPIVLVVFDELSLVSLLDESGAIDAARFPNFARLAQSSWWFPRATAAASMTERAIPALLTGNYPGPEERAPTASDYPSNLFTWLGPQRESYAVEVLTALCPPTICRSLDQELRSSREPLRELAIDLGIVFLHQVTPPEVAQRTLPPLSGTWRGFAAPAPPSIPQPEDRASFRARALERFVAHVREDRPAIFRAALERAGRANSLTFVHSLLPHIPWEYLPSGRRYAFEPNALPAGVDREVWLEEPEFVRSGYHRYLLQVSFVDRLIGELLDRLEASGSLDESLLIVTADHGVSVQPGQPRRSLSADNAPELVRVPLFVKTPSQRAGRVSQRLASGVDIVPTIADALGASLPWTSDGASLLAADFPVRTEVRMGESRLALDAVFAPPPDWQRGAVDGASPDRMVLAGPHFRALKGRSPDELPVHEVGGLALRSSDLLVLEGRGSLPDFVPAMLRGEIVGAKGDEALAVAVAVNGRIEATARTFSWLGMGNYFTLVLPEAAFGQSRSAVECFVIRPGSKAELSLVPLPLLRPTSLRLARERHGEVLTDDDQAVFRVSEPTFQLAFSLDRSYARAGVVGFVGWAADLTARRPPTQLIISLEGSGLLSSQPNLERREVARRYGERLVSSGYAFELPRATFDAALPRDPRLETLRFFALFGNEAVELPLPAALKEALAKELAGAGGSTPDVP